MNGVKRTDDLSTEEVQRGNRTWWTENPMTYDWRGQVEAPRYSEAWFEAIDAAHLFGARLFATRDKPFDRLMPLDRLAGLRVLEIGCGMGLHTETMARAGAHVTALDLTPTAIEATSKRLALRGLEAELVLGDAEELPFADQRFDFVWSWGVIHHSSSTARVVRQIARVLKPEGECRIMVYNREGMSARVTLLKDHLLNGGFLRRSFEETLYHVTDGFSARYYVTEQFEDLFRGFFKKTSTAICGQDSDVIPLPRQLRELALALVPESYLEAAQARRGSFIFLKASQPR